MDLAVELGKVGLFRGLDQESFAEIASLARERTLASGEVLFHEDRVGDEAFVIVHGTVKLERTSPEGVDEQLSVLGSGSYVGEICLVSDEHKHAFTVTALEKTFVVGFRQEDIEGLAAKHPQMGCEIYKALSQGLARRLSVLAHDAAHFKSVALHHS